MKYRKKVLDGKIGERERNLIRKVCKNNDIEIIAGHVSKDMYIYLYRFHFIYQ